MASKVLHFSLDISKLKFVLKVLRFHKFPEARWFDFGLNLGLLHPTLEAVESAHRANPSRCLMECLTKWLTKADDNVTTVGPITWRTLANALREMELKSIADNIHKTMADPVSEILQCFIGRLAQVVLSEESVDLLHTEGVVSKETSTEVKSCGCSLVGDPMLLILRAVAEDHNKLCTLASILMKSKEAALLANEMIMEYDKSFPSAVLVIPPCEQASTSVASQNSSTAKAQVTTNTDAAQSVVEVILHPGHKAEFDRMGDLLGTLIDDIAPLIEASIPSLNKFKTYLGRCRRELKLKLKDADSFDDVMEVIEGECSIVNIALLETIVNKYSIQDAADKILAYQTHLDEFCENNLTMFCNHQFKRLSSSLLTCETIKFVLKWNPSEHSLFDIRGLLWKTFKDNQVEVVVIEEGNSTIVTCYAPHYLMESLLLTARENLDILKEEMGLISLTIGYFTVYDQHVIDEEVRSLMKKLEMIENERNDLLEEIAILKGSDNTDSQKHEHSKKKMTKAMQMEIDQLRSSLQSKTGLEEALSTRDEEIEMLQEKISLLNIQQMKEVTIKKDQSTQSEVPPKGPIYVAKFGYDQKRNDELSFKKGEKFEIIKEFTDEWSTARSLVTGHEGFVPSNFIAKEEDNGEVSTLESLELFDFAMTENVDMPKIKEIKTCDNIHKASLFLTLIKQDPVLLDQLRSAKREKVRSPIRWYYDGVQMISPSSVQCHEVLSVLQDNHETIRIAKSSPDVLCDLFSALLHNEIVKSLRIQDTQLTQECISSLCNLLANNQSLTFLDLDDCSIGDKEVSDITNSLMLNNTLETLVLFDNPLITSASAETLSELIINNSTLTTLHLRYTSMSSEGVLLLLQSLSVNKRLKLDLGKEHEDTCRAYPDYDQIKDRLLFH